MDSIVWIVLGLALAAVIAARLREERAAPGQRAFGPPFGEPNTFHASHAGMFDVQVIALEFDESGPAIFVNGRFTNKDEPLDIWMVTAEAPGGNGADTFVPFDPGEEDGPGESRVGDLVSLSAPVFLSPGERGMFRAPLFSPEREERLMDTLDTLDAAAARMVEKYDREFESYSLDGESLKRIEDDFARDIVVKEIADGIGRELFWRPGRLSFIVSFLSSDETVIESIPITINVERGDFEKLRENIGAMITNSLRAELELDSVPYNCVVYEKA